MVSTIDNCASFYFIGIGGVSMSALAKILLHDGKKIGGYDRACSEYTEELQRLGVQIDYVGGNVAEYDAVVFTDAIADNDLILLQARKLNKMLIPRGQLLFEVSQKYKSVLAVAGSHGKTTCTAMLAHIFDVANKKYSAHIGGNDVYFGNCVSKGRDYFITEACEYKKNFLRLKPTLGVILNSDADHLDCYGTAENLKKAYQSFATNSQQVIKLFGDLEGVEGVTFGFDDRADYYAKSIRGNNAKYSFVAYEKGVVLGKIKLNVYGKHNVLNALAALACARVCGVDFDDIVQGLNLFCGVERRFENIGTINGAACVADYAHHPNELRAALKTAQTAFNGNVYVVFQPHTYSRTKTLFKQFVHVLSPLKKLLIYKTYAAREYYDDAGSALTLSKAIKNSRYGENPSEICKFLTCAKEGDVVLFLGAGDIYDVAKALVDE